MSARIRIDDFDPVSGAARAVLCCPELASFHWRIILRGAVRGANQAKHWRPRFIRGHFLVVDECRRRSRAANGNQAHQARHEADSERSYSFHVIASYLAWFEVYT